MSTLVPSQLRILPKYFYFSRVVLTREPKVAGRSLVLSSGCTPFTTAIPIIQRHKFQFLILKKLNFP